MKEYIKDDIKFDIKCTYIVKAAAVILMMVHHLFYCAPGLCEKYGVNGLLIPYNVVSRFGGAAKVCVSIFVFLTAYGMSETYGKINFSSDKRKAVKIPVFSIKRYTKLMMNFIVIYILTFLAYFLRGGGCGHIWTTKQYKRYMEYFY
ncbi:MAG: hypothetical protein HFH68_01830 [Lachnospiraceae bacterium]|nr:hypothetical protein [Lachnospiraceae bacterium]